jgi:VIT1/CCC1 family predicted Fe2+/Mn2+ transporter
VAPRRVLDPLERASEIVFGLLMVLTFTGSIDVAMGGREEVGTILAAAVGCNLAWGIVDASMYLLTSFSERSRRATAIAAVCRAGSPAIAYALIREALPELLAQALGDSEVEALRRRVCAIPESRDAARLTRDDYLGAAATFLLVFLSTLPVVIPFLVVERVALALRLSHAVAIVRLFAAGWSVGAHAGVRPLRSGLAMVGLGLALASVTIALGG